MAKDTFYFQHDYNARADRKLSNLMMKHGMAGIGIYWCIVEMLYEEGGYLPLEYERITFELRSNNELIKSVIHDFNLFKTDTDKFWSETALERLQERCEKSEKARESINKRWDKYKNTNVLRSNIKRNTRRGEERKGEEKRRKEKKVFIPPLLSEVESYFEENGYKKEVAKRAWMGYDAAGWHDSKGKQVLNWKQKMIQVWFSEENKINATSKFEPKVSTKFIINGKR